MKLGPHRLALGVSAALLGLVGATAITVALGRQQHAPQPPLTVATDAANPGAIGEVRNAMVEAADLAINAPPPGPTATTAAKNAPPEATRPIAPMLSPSAPLQVTIPAIGVKSSLLTLGQNADGSLEVPPRGPSYNQAGWYRYSPTPGAMGPAVIVGHVDSAVGGPSVFFRLGALHPDDRVMVTRADGSIATFAVDTVRRYEKTDFPTAAVYGDINHAALRLVTCGGSFDHSTGHYRDNIVVTASLVSA